MEHAQRHRNSTLPSPGLCYLPAWKSGLCLLDADGSDNTSLISFVNMIQSFMLTCYAMTFLQVFLHGGRNNAVLDDLFVFDMMDRTWSEVVTDSTRPPPARHSHILTVYKDELVLFGGQGTLGGSATNLYKLPIPDRSSPTLVYISKTSNTQNCTALGY